MSTPIIHCTPPLTCVWPCLTRVQTMTPQPLLHPILHATKHDIPISIMLSNTYSPPPVLTGQCSQSLKKRNRWLQHIPDFCHEGHTCHQQTRHYLSSESCTCRWLTVMSTHMCDIHIDGLPVTLTGHIIPDLSVALLFGIRVSREAECTVKFDKHKVTVCNINCVILMGNKDKTTDLWTLPLGSSMTTHHSPTAIPLVAPVCANAHAHLPT